MNYFALVVHGTKPTPSKLVRAYERPSRTSGSSRQWHRLMRSAVLTAGGSFGKSWIAHDREMLAVGTVRLDNRIQAARWCGGTLAVQTDLELVFHLIRRTGTAHIRELLGDFAFVVWDDANGIGVAATDPFNVKKLFYSQHNHGLSFSSCAEALSVDDRYDEQYLAERAALCTPTPGLTPYAGVCALPPGTIATVHEDRLSCSTFWSAAEVRRATWTSTLANDAPDALRSLLLESLEHRVTKDGRTWAHLSGGLDSSSIVSATQWHHHQHGGSGKGLGGTVTYVDWQGTDSDERVYSEHVVKRWGLQNEMIIDPPLWFDPSNAPPQLDIPHASLPFYPRDLQVREIVHRAGGRVLLSGTGADELFTGNTIFFADRLARGHLITAAREMADWSARGRISFWSFAFGNAIRPLIPIRFRRPNSIGHGRLVPWITERMASRYDLRSRTHVLATDGGRIGHKYDDAMTQSLGAMTAQLPDGVIGETLEVRYPFLYRPLVEFALSLPAQACMQPHARKWILREAMRDIVPDPVRTRVGKGGSTDALLHSLIAQRDRLILIVTDSMLADLGIVDPVQFRAAFDQAPREGDGETNVGVDLQATLALEAWLRIRSGRWSQVA